MDSPLYFVLLLSKLGSFLWKYWRGLELDHFQCSIFVGDEPRWQQWVQEYTHAGRPIVQETEFEGYEVGSCWT